jgi:hypothetical protein
MTVKLEHLDLNKINLHNPYKKNNSNDSNDSNDYDIIVDLSYALTDKINNKKNNGVLNGVDVLTPISHLTDINKPFMIEIDYLDVDKVNTEHLNDVITLNVSNNESVRKIFDDIDNYIISKIQERKIMKTYNLKKFSYVPISGLYKISDTQSYEILKFDISNDHNNPYYTRFFYNSTREVNFNDVKHDLVNSKIKFIVELLNVTFNQSRKSIHINNLIRIVKIKKSKINRIIHIDYPFADSDQDIQDIQDNNKNIDIDVDLDKIIDDNIQDDKKSDDKDVVNLSQSTNSDVSDSDSDNIDVECESDDADSHDSHDSYEDENEENNSDTSID